MQRLLDRWRPRVFAEVVGQDHAVRALKAFVRNPASRPGAILLSGPRGTGKTTLSRIYARSLACRSRTGVEPCGTCAFCEDPVGTLALTEINAADKRGIDDVREYRDLGLYYLSTEHKAIVLDEAHALTKDAQTALLKALEEPHGGTTWILCTTEPEKLLSTVSSRATPLELHALSDEEILERIRQVSECEGFELDDAILKKIATRAEGSIRDAIKRLPVAAAGGMVEGPDADDFGGPFVEAALAGEFERCDELIADGVAACRDVRILFDSVIDSLYESLSENAASGSAVASLPPRHMEELLDTLGSRRQQVDRGVSDVSALRAVVASIHLAVSMPRRGKPDSEQFSLASGDAPEWWRTRTCPTPQSPTLVRRKDGKPLPPKPCGRDRCPVCGAVKAERYRARFKRSGPEIHASVVLSESQVRPGKKSVVDRISSRFGESLLVWYLQQAGGRTTAEIWMKRKDSMHQLDRSAFEAAVRREAGGAAVAWTPLPNQQDEGFLLMFRASWQLDADEVRTRLKHHLDLNGRLVRGSHGFFTDDEGRPLRKKQVALS